MTGPASSVPVPSGPEPAVSAVPPSPTSASSMPMPSIPTRVVLVTGAAGGLGRAIAQRYAADGAAIAAIDRDTDALQSLARELATRGTACLPIACDVTEAPACAAAIAATIAHFGGLDVLVANAGISHRSALAQTGLQVIRRVMEVNFFGAVHFTHAALPALIARRGSIVVISSVAGYSPLIGRTGYSASKHALHGFFDSLRTELEPDGVSVTLACPSFIDTGIDRNALGGDGRPAARPRKETGDRATPQAVAQQVFAAAQARRPLVLVGRTAWLAWWISRLAPRRYAAIMAGRLRGEISGDSPGR